MGETQEVQLHITSDGGAKGANSLEDNSNLPSQVNQTEIKKEKKTYRYIKIAIFAAFMLLGQSSATLLGRLYYAKGGKSKWLGTLIQLAGFPILLPYKCILREPKNKFDSHKPSPSMFAFIYVSFGLMTALDCFLYSVGLQFLPVSTYSLICTSQLAFNALFSYFLNSLKFTPYIINSLLLLTISSTLLVLQNEPSSGSTQVTKKNYAIGFICTVAASSGYGLLLSLTQLVFRKVLKRASLKVVLDLLMYQCLVASLVILVGLFASGEWKGLKNEAKGYESGKASYFLTVIFAAIVWQVANIGCLGLIFEVSSVFANAIGILGVPFIPILAVIFFHDKMHGAKAISLVLAVWGFISYVYQDYLDNRNATTQKTSDDHAPNASLPLEEGH
ncbi:PREDICTED: probable purine permease 10 isoform X2 [Lupinus angustifolius]|uniref:probable purine permease 10 isoform X2 n=1 Tax=Lupinus angustifolius TaxID=3871 RepID=UPI00092FBC2C|nr:PREDICTED: probable purine permease 10 isoform X2 [Lupinus angustifolius]